MRLLHIIDDKKFLKFCENTFKLDFVENFYLKSGEVSLTYLESNNIDIIFIHFLRDKEINFFYNNRIKTPKIWMFWGADGFSLPLFYEKFLDDNSKRISNEIFKKKGIKAYLKHRYKISLNKLWGLSVGTRKRLSVINQMDFIVPIVPEDFEQLSKNYKIKPKLFHFNYVTDLLGDIKEFEEGNILLGNSATLSNNHISILEKLNSLDLAGRKVYIPLSYGDNFYKHALLEILNKFNNPNFIPLNDFMPFEDYQVIINSCDVMIMNHFRQQALGNIILGFLNGCTIFMNETSSLFSFLKSKGFHIKSIDDFKNLEVLNIEEKEYNSKLARQVFGGQQQLLLVRELLNKYC